MTRGATIPFNQPPVTPPEDNMIFAFSNVFDVPDNSVFAPFGDNPNNGIEPIGPDSSIGILINQAGTIHSLRLEGYPVASTTTESYSVRKNNASTAIIATTVIGNATLSDYTHSVNVVPGDLLTVMHNVTGNNNFTGILGSLSFTPS